MALLCVADSATFSASQDWLQTTGERIASVLSLANCTITTAGGASGLPLDQRGWQVITLMAGRQNNHGPMNQT